MSTSFEDALARARQIAAKIGGNIPANGAESGKKRAFEDNDDQPEAKKVATDDITQQLRNIADQQRASQAAAMAAQAASHINAKLGITTPTSKPLISNFQSTAAAHGLADPQEIARMLGFTVNTSETTTVPDKMVGYLIGKGGEQITAIQAESKCVVQFVTESDGTAERKCILTGTHATIHKAKDVLNRLVSNFRAGGTSGGGHNNNNNNNMDDPANQLEMFVPGTKVGLIIGKSGETIKGLMEATGTKIVVIQESNAATPHEKPVRITGDKENCMRAKQKILELIKDSNMPGMAVNSYGTPMMSGDGRTHAEMSVPRNMVGLVIGKGGEMIKKISEESGSRVQFKGEDDGTFPTRMLSVDGTEETNRIAMKMVTNLMDSAMKQNALQGGQKGGGSYGQDWSANAQSQYNLTVPTEKCGIIIGKGGETIRDINRISGAFVELDRNANQSPADRIFKVIGNGDQVMNAVRLVCEKAQLPNPMMDGYGGMGGGGYSGMNHPRPPYGPQGGMGGPMMGNPMMGGGGGGMMGNPMMGGMNQGWGMYPGYNMDPNKPSQGAPNHPHYPGQPGQGAGGGGGHGGAGAGNQGDIAAAWAAYYAQYYSQSMMPGYPAASSQANNPAAPGAPAPAPVGGAGGGGGGGGHEGANGSSSSGANASSGGGRDAGGGGGGDSKTQQGQQGAPGSSQPDYTAAWAEYYRSQGMHQHAAALMQMSSTQQAPVPSQPSSSA